MIKYILEQIGKVKLVEKSSDYIPTKLEHLEVMQSYINEMEKEHERDLRTIEKLREDNTNLKATVRSKNIALDLASDTLTMMASANMYSGVKTLDDYA